MTESPAVATAATPESRTRRAGLTAVSNLLQQATRLLAQFVVTPILVGGLGNELYGAWRMIQDLAGYLTFGTAGATNAVKWTLAQELASDDDEAKRRQIGSTLAISVRVAAGVVVLGIVLVALSPWIVRVDPIHATAVAFALGIMVLYFATSPFLTLPGAVLRGMNLEYRAMWLRAAVSAIPPALAGAAVLLGLGLVGVAGGTFLGAAIVAAALWWVAKRAIPWFGAGRPHKGETRKMFGLSAWLLVWVFVQKALVTSDVLLLGLVLSPAAVTGYALTRFMFTTASGPLFAIVGSLMPGVGQLVGGGDWARVAVVRRHGLAVAWLLSSVGGAIVVALNASFLAIWVGPQHYAGDVVNVGLVVAGVLLTVMRFNGNMIDSTLDVGMKVRIGAAVAIALMGGGVWATHAFGPIGVVGALIASRLLLAVIYTGIMRRKIRTGGDHSAAPLVAGLRAPLACAAVLVLSWASQPWVRAASWPGLAVSVAGVGIAALAVFWFAGVSGEDRVALAGRFASLRRR